MNKRSIGSMIDISMREGRKTDWLELSRVTEKAFWTESSDLVLWVPG